MTPDTEIPVAAKDRPARGAPAQLPPRWRRLVRPALSLCALALIGAGGFYAWQTWFGDDAGNAGLITAVAQRGNVEDTVTATGTLQPKDYVDVGTQVSGQLKSLLVDLGAVVKAKQLLAEIDPSVYQAKVDGDQAQLLNQKAQLADRDAQLVLAELQYTRQQNLMRENATTKDALQIAQAARDSAIAQVNAIKAQIQQTESTLRGDEANLGYTKIYAPIAGTVVSQAAKQGQTLNANQQAPIVMRIADLSTMTVYAQVSEADEPKLKIGMDVYFTTLGGDNRRYYGNLRQVSPTPTVVNNVVLYDALFDVENPNQVLKTQMTAQVFFVLSSARNAVVVPLAALHPAASAGRARGQRGGGDRDSSTDERKPAAADSTGASTGERAAAKRDSPPPAGEKAGGAGQRPPGARTGGRSAGSDPRSQFANGDAMVSVVDDSGKITERAVKVGVTNRVSAQILSGIEVGETVVVGTKVPAAAARPQTGSALVPGAAKGGGRQ